MAVTIGVFADINDSEVDAESPMTESLWKRARDNAYWIDSNYTKADQGSSGYFLETDGSGGVQWTLTSTLGVNGTKGQGTLGSSPGSPTQIAEIANRFLMVTAQVRGATANDRMSLTLYIDQSDSTYSGVYDDTDGSSSTAGSINGTLTGSFVDITSASSETFFARVTGGNIEFYENNTLAAFYTYIWL